MMTFADRLNDRLSTAPHSLTCRPADSDDAPHIRAVIVADVDHGLAGAPPAARALVAGLRLDEWRSGFRRRTPGSRVLLISAAGEVVGALALDTMAPGAIRLLDAIIRPDRRNHGIGGTLLTALCATADQEGREIDATLLFDSPARRLLHRHGFQPAGTGSVEMEVRYHRPCRTR